MALRYAKSSNLLFNVLIWGIHIFNSCKCNFKQILVRIYILRWMPPSVQTFYCLSFFLSCPKKVREKKNLSRFLHFTVKQLWYTDFFINTDNSNLYQSCLYNVCAMVLCLCICLYQKTIFVSLLVQFFPCLWSS